MVDLHIHCDCSHDSREKLDNICRNAVQKGFTAIAISDHADMGPCYVFDTYERFVKRKAEIDAIRVKYADRLAVFEGIEMAEYLYDVSEAERLLSITDYDVVLGSVHCVAFDGQVRAYSQMDFSAMPPDKIHAFLKQYFTKIREMILKTDIDVLCHLTCPLRYINGKYGREISLESHETDIKELFSLVIQKGIALEVNTSGCGAQMSDTMPSIYLLKLYREMGGTAITLGSDAHTAERVGIGFEHVRTLLKEIGFAHALFFQKRTAHSLPL